MLAKEHVLHKNTTGELGEEKRKGGNALYNWRERKLSHSRRRRGITYCDTGFGGKGERTA